MGFLSNLFGQGKSEKDIAGLWPVVEVINGHFAGYESLSNDELRAKTTEFRTRINENLSEVIGQIEQKRKDADVAGVLEKEEIYDEIDELIKAKDEQLEVVLKELLPEAFATVKEVARRFMINESLEATATELDKTLAIDREHMQINGEQVTYYTTWSAAGNDVPWEMVHYDVQLIGGMVLHSGKIAEMATGEGKTLVATLPSYLNALAGDGVHIVTVNDYLARRDSEWMAPIMEFLGITVDCIDKHQPHSEERRNAYLADITYGTNNEFGFDYLRDNMVRSPEEQVQRKLHYAMVDEVDSVLIDDARTPLIISGPVPKGDDHEFYNLKPRIQQLVDVQKKVVQNCLLEARKQIEEGKKGENDGGLALLRAHRGLPKNKPLIKYLSEEGNRVVLNNVESYYLREQSKNMPIVDEELYFVIDEKQSNVELTEKGLELITKEGEDTDFFVMPDVGSAMVDLEKKGLEGDELVKEKDRIIQDFAVKSERVHAIQQLLKAYALFEKDVEYVVMDDKVKIVDEQTGRILDGRRYSDGLHQAIEAKENVKVEAATQTFATVTLQNYFRMFHKLAGMTGTADTEAGEFWEIYKLDVIIIPTNVPITRDDRHDLVYKTAREKYNAVADEILELTEAGRPVLVGTTSVEISELLSRMLKMKGIKHNILNAKQHQREAEIVAEAGIAGAVTIATNMAGRGTDIKLREGVKEAGGLAIVGTERHDSRRVDRQLRGRAGRQGDPGTSQFFVSLEDNLMRLFGSDRIAKLMDRMGYKEGEVIQHSMITKSIERAQKKVEENNFGTRKRLLEYDDVMNSQRTVVYKRRKHALYGERLTVDINNMIADVCEDIIATHHEARDFESFKVDMIRYFSVDPEMQEDVFVNSKLGDVVDAVYPKVHAYYQRKKDRLAEMVFPAINDVYQSKGETIDRISVPFTDGLKALQIPSDLKKAVETKCESVVQDFEQAVSLAIIDEHWKEHLRQMDDLKQSVQAAVYEQKDPLLIYKFEAFELFKVMIGEVNREITAFLFKGNIPIETESDMQAAEEAKKGGYEGQTAGRDSAAGMLADTRQVDQQRAQERAQLNTQGEQVQAPVKVAKKVGRNEPCPCGSGKKYKHCHGKS
jgi:preprotein translocase subunit SecA